jgi:hypothetical protein
MLRSRPGAQPTRGFIESLNFVNTWSDVNLPGRQATTALHVLARHCGGTDHVRAQCSAWRQWKKDTNNDAHIGKAWSGSIEKKLITASSPQQVACVARSSRDPKYAADATGETKAVWDAGH